MALNIKDRATEQVVRELAALKKQTMTEAVRHAAEDALRRALLSVPRGRLVEELMEISKRCAALPDLDTSSADEILGYDANGLPT